MDDLISRQAAIDMCRLPRMRNADCSDFEMEIMMLPPAQHEQRWIPVTDAPIPDGEHLVTLTSEKQEKPIVCIVCRYDGKWDLFELNMLGHWKVKIIAWMPIEPYTEGAKE